MIFVNSMSDLFHKGIPKEFIEQVCNTMERANWHTFQVLTKRSSLMRTFLRQRYPSSRGPLHIWFGISVEDGSKKSRVRHLQDTPAGVRFLSIEPMIGPIGKLDLVGIDWVIVGGESGQAPALCIPIGCAKCATNVLIAARPFSSNSGADCGPNQVAANSTGGSGINFRVPPLFIRSRLNDMVSLHDYVGREQSYVKHVFLENYLETLVHKTASRYPHIVYVDGFAGPWQSASEKFEDTSFGIALNALRRAKGAWKQKDRNVTMSAYLVERDASAYQRLTKISEQYPDVTVKTYNNDFLRVLSAILDDIPRNAFAFFLIDPKGWSIPLRDLRDLLARFPSEVIFNFMFDFINRAASIRDPVIVSGLDELIPFGDWRRKIENAERSGVVNPGLRKTILVEAFAQSLKQLGNYDYVAETTILRPLKDRPLYCLFYATRHPRGIEVFRDCQIAALRTESATRASHKIKHVAAITGQGEFFESLHDMASDELALFLGEQRIEAERTLLELTPTNPHFVIFEKLRTQVLARHVIKRADVNDIAARLRRENRLLFPDWEKGKKVPQASYRAQRSL
jgi:three-Cys-motif partner protein